MDRFLDTYGAASPLLEFDALMRSLPRIPYNDAEFSVLLDCTRTGRKRGLHTGAVSRQFGGLSRADAEAHTLGMLKQGVAFMACREWPLDIAIIKTDAGRGWLGKQKAAYNLFIEHDEEGGHFQRGVVRPSLRFAAIDALVFFESLQKVGEAVARDFPDT